MYYFSKDEFFYFDNEKELLKINYIDNKDNLEKLGINEIINGKMIEQK